MRKCNNIAYLEINQQLFEICLEDSIKQHAPITDRLYV